MDKDLMRCVRCVGCVRCDGRCICGDDSLGLFWLLLLLLLLLFNDGTESLGKFLLLLLFSNVCLIKLILCGVYFNSFNIFAECSALILFDLNKFINISFVGFLALANELNSISVLINSKHLFVPFFVIFLLNFLIKISYNCTSNFVSSSNLINFHLIQR